MDRAVNFYKQVFDLKLQIEKFGLLEITWFPWFEPLHSLRFIFFNRKGRRGMRKGRQVRSRE